MRALAIAALAVALHGCGGEDHLLLVDVRTDLVPGLQFDTVHTELLSGARAGEVTEHAVDPDADYARGTRVAEVTELDGDTVTVRVSLRSMGELVLQRRLNVELTERVTAVTVLLASPCINVACEEGQACVDGRCLDDRCSETSSEYCEGGCQSLADCGEASECTAVECTPSGACFAAPDHESCGADAYCEPEVGCVALFHDLGAGFESNLVRGGGLGSPATQPGEGGWTYHYVSGSRFAQYGALSARDLDPSSWSRLEHAFDESGRVGWRSPNTSVLGVDRGMIYLFHWEDGRVTSGGDSILVSPENSVSPMVEWRAPAGGIAAWEVEVRGRSSSMLADVEVHLLSVSAEGERELSRAYVSHDGAPDANAQPTTSGTADVPVELVGQARVEPGDRLLLHARIGDDDAFDAVVIRGGVRFTPRAF